MSDLSTRVVDRVKGSVNFGGWTTEHPDRPAGMWTLHNVMGFYHAVKVHEAIDQTMPILSEVDKGQDWTIWRSKKLTVRFRREAGEVWIDFLPKTGDKFPKPIEP